MKQFWNKIYCYFKGHSFQRALEGREGCMPFATFKLCRRCKAEYWMDEKRKYNYKTDCGYDLEPITKEET